MIGMRFNVHQAKGLFYDNPAIKSMLDDRTRLALIRFGAYVRRDAKRSIKTARQKTLAEMSPQAVGRYRARARRARKAGRPRPKKPRAASRPGEPPRSRTGILKKFIFFVHEPLKRSVVIGPAKLGRASGDAPAVLEGGGHTTVTVGPKGRRKNVRVKIEARPYMGPAYRENEPKIPDLFRDST